MCGAFSGTPIIDSADTYGGCVWMIELTSGRWR